VKNKITCVIPTHNRPELASRAVRSVIATGYPNLEIIVVDDASMPKFKLPLDMIDQPYIKIVRMKSPSGGAVARNVGMRSATGTFVCFLDDDDELLPNKFELMLPILLAREDIDAVVAECVIVDVKTRSQIICTNPTFSNIKNTIKNRVHTNSTLMRKGVFDRIQFNEKLSKFQDTQFNTDLCFLLKVFHIDIPVTKWYTNHGNGQITTRKGFLFTSKNYFELIRHFIFVTKIPFYLLYGHLMQLIYLFIRLK
jgi:glycosyltransferase involved in cell wall biosynthesis